MNPVVHVLTLMLAAGAAPSETIDLGRYSTAVECDLQARSVRVRQSGARLICIKRAVDRDRADGMFAGQP